MLSLRRDGALARLGEPWDVLVVGGGITGAGILAEAAKAGLRALLVEQRDYAWGTSSRSSKLVHGGLRYLKQGDFALTLHSVRERVRLVREAPGLVFGTGFLVPTYGGDRLHRFLIGTGLSIYDAMAGKRTHRRLQRDEFLMRVPGVGEDGLDGGFRYDDAQTDDARLVVRVLAGGVRRGAVALNHARVEGLLRASGTVTGVKLRDLVSGREAEVQARVVINATGAWADRLRGQVGGKPRIRPLRGSHLTFPSWRFPVAEAVMFLHPKDRRPIFVIPWEGVTLVGTTDHDHPQDLDDEPAMSERELAYLMDGLARQFPTLELGPADALASFAGVRPVIGSGKSDPSKETRDHVVWEEDGLLTVTGGKLTTFRVIARDALKAARHRLPSARFTAEDTPILDVNTDALDDVPPGTALRLAGRFGPEAASLLAEARPEERTFIPGTGTLLLELRHAVRHEAVERLDDLLLRRTRLGLLLPDGAAALLPHARSVCTEELGWDAARWAAEEAAYRALVASSYSLPGRAPAAAVRATA